MKYLLATAEMTSVVTPYLRSSLLVLSIIAQFRSRLPVQILLSLLLVLAQQVAMADATAYASHGPSHYQCSYEEGTSADADSGIHFSADHIDSGLVSSYVIPTFANQQARQTQGSFVGFCALVSSRYHSRAPPSL